MESIITAIRMLQWVACTKNKVLAVTHSPAERHTEADEAADYP